MKVNYLLLNKMTDPWAKYKATFPNLQFQDNDSLIMSENEYIIIMDRLEALEGVFIDRIKMMFSKSDIFISIKCKLKLLNKRSNYNKNYN